MSVEAQAWAYAQTLQVCPGLDQNAKGLLAAIANHADKAGVSWPGQVTLARDCNVPLGKEGNDTATISRQMKRLVALGLIARVPRRRANGSRTSDWIVVAPGAVDRSKMIDAPADEYPPEVAELACRSLDPESSDVLDAGSLDRESLDPGSLDPVPPGHLIPWGGPEPSEEPPASEPTAQPVLPPTSEGAEPGSDGCGGLVEIAPGSAGANDDQHAVEYQRRAGEALDVLEPVLVERRRQGRDPSTAALTTESVVRLIAEFPDRDHVVIARNFAAGLVEGPKARERVQSLALLLRAFFAAEDAPRLLARVAQHVVAVDDQDGLNSDRPRTLEAAAAWVEGQFPEFDRESEHFFRAQQAAVNFSYGGEVSVEHVRRHVETRLGTYRQPRDQAA